MAFQLRRDTTANWAALNPILALGELAEDVTLKIVKLGDGTTPWNSLAQYGVGPQGPTGPANPRGQVTINFGSEPGSNEASIAVSDPNILATSIPFVQFAGVATADHSVSDHNYAGLFISLTCSAPTAGVGFTIFATCSELMSGTFNLNYSWN